MASSPSLHPVHPAAVATRSVTVTPCHGRTDTLELAALALLGLSDVGKLRGRMQSAFDYYSMRFGLESVGRLTCCRISAQHYQHG